MEEKEYKYGDPIPEKYRNRLFEWEGGGSYGCLWEMNQGLVDRDGHWHPIYSTGINGIDQDGWYNRKINALKSDLGYDITLVEVQHYNAKHQAVEEVFKKKWYEVDANPDDYPEVKKLLEKEEERYTKWLKGRDQYRIERTHRLDMMFMQALERTNETERPQEIGMLDDKNIKETCRLFCDSYAGNAGMMVNCLDKLEKMGYDVWCTCSDCGEQFQRRDFDTFGCSIDSDSYIGDGGIGVIMTRVLCDECRQEVECPTCYHMNIPNSRNDKHNDWINYNLLACVMLEWLGVCWVCTDDFENQALTRWDDVSEVRVPVSLGNEYYALCKKLESQYGCKDHELYEKLRSTCSGKKTINKIRDLLCQAAKEHFGTSIEEGLLDERLNTDDPLQMKMPFMD